MLADFLYFAIKYDVELVNYILFTTNLFNAYSFIFSYDKNNLVFFATIKL